LHCPAGRSYSIFDPQTQEENDRLDPLPGATKLWEATIQKRRRSIQADGLTQICPFSELHPVGWTQSGEGVAVVLAGAIVKTKDQIQGTGQWFAIRVAAGGEDELLQDLEAEIESRKQRLVSAAPAGSIKSISRSAS
jgi:hypothetical protein